MKTWLWPDRAIGKRESRELREAHNATVNMAAELLHELLATKSWMEDCMLERQQRGLPSRERYEAVAAIIAKAHQARGGAA